MTQNTAQQIGAVKTYQAKVEGNPILREYSKLYRRFHKRKSLKMITSDQFAKWTASAKIIRDKALQEDISFKEFQDQMDKIGVD